MFAAPGTEHRSKKWTPAFRRSDAKTKTAAGLRVRFRVRSRKREPRFRQRRLGKACRGRLQDEDQHVNLPDFGDEGQAHDDCGADQIQAHQQRAARQPLGECAGHGRDGDKSDHLDGKGRPEHLARIGAGELEGEQPERDGGQPRADQGDGLRHEQVSVGPVCEHVHHGSLKVFGDIAELVDRAPLLGRQRFRRLCKEVVEMSRISVLLAAQIAFSTAWSCWARSRQGRPASNTPTDAAEMTFGAPDRSEFLPSGREFLPVGLCLHQPSPVLGVGQLVERTKDGGSPSCEPGPGYLSRCLRIEAMTDPLL